jgi:DNA polymerase elongation subunit (family B)
VSLSDRLLALAPRHKEPRVLTIDIETLPGTALYFSRWNVNIGMANVLESPRIGCFAAKWYGKRTIHFHSEHRDGQKAMLERLWHLLNEADVVVTYNGDSFDIPWIRGELAVAGHDPWSPFLSVDLIKTVRRFKFDSKRLDDVVQRYGIGRKMDTGGIELWKGALAGDSKAWAKMRRYNCMDVEITERLLDEVRPYATSLPHLGQWTRDRECCPSCGGNDLTLVGLVYGKTTAYPKLHCEDCGAWVKVLRNGDTRLA